MLPEFHEDMSYEEYVDSLSDIQRERLWYLCIMLEQQNIMFDPMNISDLPAIIQQCPYHGQPIAEDKIEIIYGTEKFITREIYFDCGCSIKKGCYDLLQEADPLYFNSGEGFRWNTDYMFPDRTSKKGK